MCITTEGESIVIAAVIAKINQYNYIILLFSQKKSCIITTTMNNLHFWHQVTDTP